MGKLSRPHWVHYFKSGTIVDVSVRTKEILYVLIRPDLTVEEPSMMWDSENPTYLCAIYFSEPPEDNLDGWKMSGLSRPKLGVAMLPKPCAVLISNDIPNIALAFGKDVDRVERFEVGHGMILRRIKTLFGNAYAVGARRVLYKRIEAGEWMCVGSFPKGDDISEVGFADIDGFAEDDIYAVGGRGDVWHFDGTAWNQLGFPSTVELATVTCAGDGKVYISGEGGSLWVGARSTWDQKYESQSGVPWNDVLWFADRLWLASDYQFGFWNGDAVEVPCTSGGEQMLTCGHMDARDGLLAIASPHNLLTFDGSKWETVVEKLE